MYELAEEWADEFETLHQGDDYWIELDFFETIEEFLQNKNKQ